MFRDGDRWTGIVSDNNMIGLNAVFNSVTSTNRIVAGGTGTKVLTDEVEIYPLVDGTSTFNTRYTVKINDEDGVNGYVSTNYYGVGGVGN